MPRTKITPKKQPIKMTVDDLKCYIKSHGNADQKKKAHSRARKNDLIKIVRALKS